MPPPTTPPPEASATAAATTVATPATRNLILDYYDRLPEVIARCVEDVTPVQDPTAFSPGFLLPEPDAAVRELFAAAEARWWELGDHDGRRISLLDLTRNPGTYTTETPASLLIVARAVEYIRRTGEAVLIFSPTSANKGTALRDAVRRAVDCGLAEARQLRVAVLAPASCREKLRGDGPDPALNPIFLYDGASPRTSRRSAGRSSTGTPTDYPPLDRAATVTVRTADDIGTTLLTAG